MRPVRVWTKTNVGWDYKEGSMDKVGFRLGRPFTEG